MTALGKMYLEKITRPLSDFTVDDIKNPFAKVEVIEELEKENEVKSDE